MLYDFHTHSFLSDGELSPVELARRAIVNGCQAIAITDHVSWGNCETVLRQLVRDCELINRHWDILALPGVEITHAPAQAIPEIARLAREAGAQVVAVHGETIVEPVEPGTNLVAVGCPLVDILAHPGLLRPEEARLAAENGIFLELSARKGHSLTNGQVLKVGRAAGARFLLNSDAHAPGDLLTPGFARQVALGAGLGEEELEEVLRKSPLELIQRVMTRCK